MIITEKLCKLEVQIQTLWTVYQNLCHTYSPFYLDFSKCIAK